MMFIDAALHGIREDLLANGWLWNILFDVRMGTTDVPLTSGRDPGSRWASALNNAPLGNTCPTDVRQGSRISLGISPKQCATQ